MDLHSTPLGQYFAELSFTIVTAATLLGYVSVSFTQEDWMKTICEQQFSSLATDFQLALCLDFEPLYQKICLNLNHSVITLARCLRFYDGEINAEISLPLIPELYVLEFIIKLKY